MNKKALITLIIITLCIQTNGWSQRYANNSRVKNLEFYDAAPYHFGFVMGVDQMNFSLVKNPNYRLIDSLQVTEPRFDYGFHIGIVSNLRTSYFTDLRFIPMICFGERQIYYRYTKMGKTVEETKKVESNILYFPLQFKYKSARMTNTRVYVIAGAGYALDLASQSKKKKINTEEAVLKLNSSDVFYEFGIGFDFYLVYFKFGTEIKYSGGIRNLIKQENNLYTSPIDNLTSKLLIFSLTFE